MTIILDGTTGITTPAINSSGDLELPGGTANGVLYLNGSKVATSGSALVFDGTNLGVGTSSPDRPLHVFYNVSTVGAYTAILQGAASGYGAGISFQSVLEGTSTLAEMCRITADGEAAWNSTTANQDAGLRFYTALDGTVAERVRISAAGNLGVGTTTPLSPLDVVVGAGGARRVLVNYDDSIITIKGASNTANPETFKIVADNIRFNTGTTGSGTERARITVGGYFKASNDGTYIDATSSQFEFRGDTTVALMLFENKSTTNPYGLYMDFSGSSPDNNANYFLYAEDSTTVRCIIYSDGDLANHDGVYGTISDERLKQDIADAGSQWDDLKAIRFRKYRMKTDVEADPNAPSLLGVVAQELEEVCPGLVDEHPDMETVEVTDEDSNVKKEQRPTGTTTKTVKSSILLMKAAVALQEAMTRIENLEAEVSALKGV
jgi:hypothetical protein